MHKLHVSWKVESIVIPAINVYSHWVVAGSFDKVIMRLQVRL